MAVGRAAPAPDKACADQVQDGWKAYRSTMKERLGSAATPSDEQDARGKVIDTEMKACLGKFEPAEKPQPAEKPRK